jgi:hypothetical protein
MKIAIVGTAPGSRAVAPFDDPTWDIWGCSQGNTNQLPRLSMWFELHSVAWMEGKENASWLVPYLSWLRGLSCPVYMQERNELVPQAIPYPLQTVVKEFGRNWFQSTVAYMMAFALVRGAREIGLFGVDMAAGQEHYTGQRAGLWRFFEHAKDRGVTVHVPWESCLGEPPPLYGYCEATRMGRKLFLRKEELQSGRAQIAAKIEQAKLEMAYFDGAIEQNDYMIRTFLDGMDADLAPGPRTEPAIADIPAPAQRPPDAEAFELKPSGLLLPREKANGSDTISK